MAGYDFTVQQRKKIRVIIDTDAACEADDPYAIVQALYSPRLIIEGITAEQFGGNAGKDRASNTVEKSFKIIEKVLELTGSKERHIPLLKGEEFPLENENEDRNAPAVNFIIKEALAVHKSENLLDKKLYILCQGAVTNIAAALIKAPEIADKIRIIWIGGAAYPLGGWEFNLINDYVAANVLLKSQAELWQVPNDCYSRMLISYAELQEKVKPCGKIGEWLFRELVELGAEAEWICGESWVLGDNPAIGLAINALCGHYIEKDACPVDSKGYYQAPLKNRKIRVYNEIDSRFIFEDLFSKLRLNNNS